MVRNFFFGHLNEEWKDELQRFRARFVLDFFVGPPNEE